MVAGSLPKNINYRHLKQRVLREARVAGLKNGVSGATIWAIKAKICDIIRLPF